MRKRLFQGDHPDVASSLNNLAILLVQTSRPTEALELMKQATEVEDKIISRVFGFSSERERLAHMERNRTTFEWLLSLVLNYLQDSPTAVQTALDVVLKRKKFHTPYNLFPITLSAILPQLLTQLLLIHS